jgi:rifampicin phosphotransferase
VPEQQEAVIAWLGEAVDQVALGGKGASLDRLIRMGFRVPPGFCITTAGFLAQRSSLDADGWTGDGRPPWVEDLASGSLVPEVAEPLEEAIERLVAALQATGVADPRLAVRSSAIGEDGGIASYAGLHETELDLEARDVAGAVARCWASLWSPAALAYRARRALPIADTAMAVVVQALVPADAAAVAFTRHPVTGREDHVVITAVRGLGDAMVAGTVTPDTYVVDKASRTTLEVDRGEDPAGPALDDRGLADLVDLALSVEARFDGPVDIEAARSRGSWYLLQARPITALAIA